MPVTASRAAATIDWPGRRGTSLRAWGLSLAAHTALLIGLTWPASLNRLDNTDPLAGAEATLQDRPVQITLIHRSDGLNKPNSNAGSSAADEASIAQGGTGEAGDELPIVVNMTTGVDLAKAFGAAKARADARGGSLGPGVIRSLVQSDLGRVSGIEGLASGNRLTHRDRGLDEVAESTLGRPSWFGVASVGRRFVYVIDRSGSMSVLGASPLRAAMTELGRSLESLTEAQSFQIILYNDQPQPYFGGASWGGPPRMVPAESRAVQRARRFLGSVSAFGGTNHLDALRMALRMNPDVVYFLTDGHTPSLGGKQLRDIRRLADRRGTIIHGIEFGESAEPVPQTFVRKLAQMCRGEYRYFSIGGLSSWHAAAEP